MLADRQHENAMSFATTVLPEFDQEMASTRKALARVPTDKATFKPHPKSFALGHLTQLIASMPGWIVNMTTKTELDLAASPGYSFESTETLLDRFDTLVKEARAALTAAKDSDFDVSWSLKHGERVLFTSPRGATIRSTLNHLIHHRGQLTVYLRLIDVPVPSLYGPTADEPW
jgi:uncharacterized damage-inducible protein DinB